MDIKKVFKEKGLTSKDVAERLGMTPVGLSQHINGNPTVQVLERIAEAVGCDVADFFTASTGASLSCPHCGKPINIKVE
mgnify:CR=1 FL=1